MKIKSFDKFNLIKNEEILKMTKQKEEKAIKKVFFKNNNITPAKNYPFLTDLSIKFKKKTSKKFVVAGKTGKEFVEKMNKILSKYKDKEVVVYNASTNFLNDFKDKWDERLISVNYETEELEFWQLVRNEKEKDTFIVNKLKNYNELKSKTKIDNKEAYLAPSQRVVLKGHPNPDYSFIYDNPMFQSYFDDFASDELLNNAYNYRYMPSYGAENVFDLKAKLREMEYWKIHFFKIIEIL